MWNTLSNAIVNKIKESSEVDSTAVFDYAKSQITEYPAITVTASDNANPSFADTVRNRRSYVFSVKIYQEMTEKSEQDAERILRTLVDDVIDLFDTDRYINDALAGRGFAFPIPSVWRFIQSEQATARMAEVLIECVVIT